VVEKRVQSNYAGARGWMLQGEPVRHPAGWCKLSLLFFTTQKTQNVLADRFHEIESCNPFE